MKLTIIIISVIIAGSKASPDGLKFVSVLHRHGDRSPTSIYPTDPYQASTWPNGLGQLTNTGKNHCYQLGTYLRDRYRNFLPLKYSEEDIRIISSDKGRTLMSAYLVLAGLYKPEGDDVWSEDIHWQPIPVHNIPSAQDNLLAFEAPCPKYQILYVNAQASNSENFSKYGEIAKELFQHTNTTSINVTEDVLNAKDVWDALSIEEKNDLKLPDWAGKFYPQPLLNLSEFIFALYTGNPELQRLRCGPLLKFTLEKFEKVVNGEKVEKIWQYSAHDQTIVDLLQCLNVFDRRIPSFASAVFLELYDANDGGFEVLISYKKEDVVKELTIPGCSIRCPFDLFKELVSDVIPGDWDQECKLGEEKNI